MKKAIKKLHRFRDILRNIYLGSNSRDYDLELNRKILLINVLCTIGIVIMTPFIFISFHQGKYLLSIFNFIASTLLIFTFFYLRLTRDYLLTAYFFLSFIGAMLLYVIASGGIQNTGPLWVYGFPLIIMFLLGTKKGIIGNAIFFLIALIILFLPGTPFLLTSYTMDFKVRFLLTQVLVCTIAFFVEWGRAKTHNSMTGKTIELEKRIVELKKKEEEQNQLQEKLLTAGKLETIGTMAGGMAHELNNQISIVEGNTELLRQEFIGIDNNSIQKKIISIKKAATQIASLTNQLLSFSRKQILQLETESLNDVINRNRCKISQTLGNTIEMIFSLEENLWNTRVDTGLMIQMIIDIVLNARDAMPEGGRLYIRTVNIEKNQKHYVCLTFQDTGIGMDSEISEKIFDPFFTTKRVGQGMGLGLSSAYGIIKQHDGWIDVSSAPGKGTCLNVFIPAFQEDLPISQ